MQVQLGCFTYVFSEYPFATALASIAGAGYRYLGLGLAPREAPIPGDESSEQEGRQVRRMLADTGLTPVFTFAPSLASPGGVDRFKRRIEFCHAAQIPFIITMGSWGYKQWPDARFTPAELAPVNAALNTSLRELAPVAAQAGVTLLLKPHTGSTATSKECLETMAAIDHPAVRLCYDAGNVRFYEGIAPEEDVVPVLPYVRALCLKDHQGPRANANFPVPGEGGIDHTLLFSRLKEGGFNGPMVVERVDGRMQKADLPLMVVIERISRARKHMEAALAEVGATVA